MTIPFMNKFRNLSYKFLLKFNRSHFTPQVKLFLVEKGNLKFSVEKEIRKILTLNSLDFKLQLKFSRK